MGKVKLYLIVECKRRKENVCLADALDGNKNGLSLCEQEKERICAYGKEGRLTRQTQWACV